MTDFDKKLIEKANTFSRWAYRDINVLIDIADTAEARQKLLLIRNELLDLVEGTL